MKRCKHTTRSSDFISGLKTGLPIGAGYLAVGLSMGFMAHKAGLTAWQGFLLSLLGNSSSGEYGVLTLIKEHAAFFDVLFMAVIANLRYILMSCSLGQRLDRQLPLAHRLLMSYDITDEIFAAAISRDGAVSPYFIYGCMAVSLPLWAGGTALGVLLGAWLPAALTNALGVALYGMFLSAIIPASKSDHRVAFFVALSFLVSTITSLLPVFQAMSDGLRVFLFTILLSLLAAWRAPVAKQAGVANG